MFFIFRGLQRTFAYFKNWSFFLSITVLVGSLLPSLISSPTQRNSFLELRGPNFYFFYFYFLFFLFFFFFCRRRRCLRETHFNSSICCDFCSLWWWDYHLFMPKTVLKCIFTYYTYLLYYLLSKWNELEFLSKHRNGLPEFEIS